uniref:Uncharacterized protein n=1 Tax=Globisporangium ultimum (strain ATCC 200006 / CBS 805.95 / DAOM BR144) TaxID=431595 RepID=K3WFG9_GLOUD
MQQQLEAFFTHGDPPCDDSSAASSPSTLLNDTPSSILYVHGPAHAGQTSLLLQYGFTQAKRSKSVVLVLCGEDASTHRPTIVPIAPCLKCGVPMKTGGDNLVWSRIQIKYIRNSTELQHFLCSFHMLKEKSSVLLIDSFERFFGSDRFLGNVYQTLAYLYETLLFMQTSTGCGQVVVTGATDSFILQETQRNWLRRWCSFLALIEAADDGAGEFLFYEETEDAESDDDDDSDKQKKVLLR